MEIIDIDPRELRRNPFNPNSVGVEGMRRLEASLSRHGWVRPVIARRLTDGSLEILGGQHRTEAAINLGHVTVPVVDLGKLDDSKAMEIGLIDNARYGADDADQLAEVLATIGATVDVSSFLPYSSDDLAELTNRTEVDIEALLEGENLPDVPQIPTPKPARTHTVLRFKVPLGDADKISERITEIQRTNGFTEADSLTNAGDALAWLFSSLDKEDA